MNNTYLYFQPEYVSKFKCDGQACEAHCCKRHWRIDIDKKTYKKYERIKPKSAANKILQHIYKDQNQYIIRLIGGNRCPMLTEDNWCSIQKKYGEEYLSDTCVTYPRRTFQVGNFYERSLNLSCPVVAVQVLLAEEPMTFEQVEVSEKIHSNLGKMQIEFAPVEEKLLKYVSSVQFAAISILQERALSIDKRLIVLGFFLDKLDEIISADKLSEIENLTALYSSEKFLTEKTSEMINSINFDAKEHMKIMFGTFEALYQGESNFARKDQKFINSVIDTFQIKPDEEDQVSTDDLVKEYDYLSSFRDKVIEVFGTMFEHYLVNEFFITFYPWASNRPIIQNYGIFVTTYKMLELITMSIAWSNFKNDSTKIPPLSKPELVGYISKFANNIDHDKTYITKISNYLKDKDDIISLMQSLLRA